jgi:hypothetical protein
MVSRYSLVFPLLKAPSRALYANIAGLTNVHQHVTLTTSSKLAISLWIAALLSIFMHGADASRKMLDICPTIGDLRTPKPQFYLCFDGSPKGAGTFIVPTTSQMDLESIKALHDKGPITINSVIATFWSQYPFSWAQSKETATLPPMTEDGRILSKEEANLTSAFYQNLSELIGAIIGIGHIAKYHPGSELYVEGDSQTILSWLSGGTVKSAIATKAAIILTRLMEKGDLAILAVHHRPKESNDICDGLSRGIINPALDLTKRSYCDTLVNLMSPASKLNSTDDFLNLLDSLDSWLLQTD